MIDLSELSEGERWEYLVAMIRVGKGPRARGPKKHSDILNWRDFGLTRKQGWRMRRLAKITDADLQTFLAWSLAQGKLDILSERERRIRKGALQARFQQIFRKRSLDTYHA
jgi:hypothetical protein